MDKKRNHNHNRGHVSVTGAVYESFRAWCEANDVSMAETLEASLTTMLDDAEDRAEIIARNRHA